MEKGLTIHCMVRNEPFVWYAVKSVYDYADKILLYDTGSYDDHTLEDIRRLRVEDHRGIISFKAVTIEVDETKWTDHQGPMNYRRMQVQNRGKKGKWYCRDLMIHDTKTSHFMILDGDEVHYATTMEKVRHTLDHWPKDKLCGRMPLTWMTDMSHWFKRSNSGRLFMTSEIGMTKRSPSELHTVKKTGHKIGIGSQCVFAMTVTPYAHFEVLLKPWRRSVHPSHIKPFTGELPEVMQENTEFIERFHNEHANK